MQQIYINDRWYTIAELEELINKNDMINAANLEITTLGSANKVEEALIKFINASGDDGGLDTVLFNQPSQRWLDIAKTDIQKGFMALRRAFEKNE